MIVTTTIIIKALLACRTVNFTIIHVSRTGTYGYAIFRVTWQCYCFFGCIFSSFLFFISAFCLPSLKKITIIFFFLLLQSTLLFKSSSLCRVSPRDLVRGTRVRVFILAFRRRPRR